MSLKLDSSSSKDCIIDCYAIFLFEIQKRNLFLNPYKETDKYLRYLIIVISELKMK